VVISIEEKRFKNNLQAAAHTVGMAIAQPFGKKHQLTIFDGSRFHAYLWNRLFEKTLPPEDYDLLVNRSYRILRAPWHGLHLAGLWTRWLGFSKYPSLDTRGIDVLISETPFPGIVSPGTKLVVRYHDAFPLTMPHTIKNRRYHQAIHYSALQCNVKNGAWFVCVSDSTRNELISLFPNAASRAVTIRNTISRAYFKEDSQPHRVADILPLRFSSNIKPTTASRIRRLLTTADPQTPFDYLLTVNTLEPRKNFMNLLAAWGTLRASGFPNLKLIVVGERGWHSGNILKAFRPWIERAQLIQLEKVPASELRVLYRHASVTVCPSLAEGFGYSGQESLHSGGRVAASNIATHREIYGDAAVYFQPHDPIDIAKCLAGLLREPKPLRHPVELTQREPLSWSKFLHENNWDPT
jgi:glycosyltransferase involved in cell wall biosynthesis